MVRPTYLTSLLCLSILLPFGVYGQTQEIPSQPDPAFAKLAARIAEPLRKAKAKKVVVVDLRAPGLQAHPVGKWLADQLSASLQKGFPEFEVMDRSQLKAGVNEGEAPTSPREANERDMNRAGSLGADMLITGTFGKVSQAIGVSLLASSASGNSHSGGSATGGIPISEEISALFPGPIPSVESNGAFRPGVAGISFPSCSHCPPPQYTSEARKAHYQGTVVLQIVVTADGRAKNIRVVSGPGMGLEDSAIRVVRDWRFKPAVDWDGNSVPVISPVEVTYRLK
jgi:TonB family protein